MFDFNMHREVSKKNTLRYKKNQIKVSLHRFNQLVRLKRNGQCPLHKFGKVLHKFYIKFYIKFCIFRTLFFKHTETAD